MTELIIDSEFKELMPPLPREKRDRLEENVLQFGIQDALKTWNGILIDGHNRYEIAKTHGLAFATSEMQFNSRDDVKLWIVNNQFGRRDLSTYERSVLALKIKPVIAKLAKEKESERKTTFQKSEKSSLPTVNTTKEIAKAAGVSHDTIAKVEKIEQHAAPEIKAALKSGDLSINQAYKEIKRAEKAQRQEEHRAENVAKVETLATPLDAKGLFQTIVIDPPWDWGDEGDVNQFGRAKPEYSTMPFDDIKNLPVSKIADTNCHLYLWVTNRSLPKAFALIDAWGFRYITCLTWVKPSIGMGNYFRGSTEQILFAVKGSQPLRRHDVGTHFTAPRGSQHSSKPDEFYSLVESCSYPPFIDIFGRTERDGWSVWGENG